MAQCSEWCSGCWVCGRRWIGMDPAKNADADPGDLEVLEDSGPISSPVPSSADAPAEE